MIGIDIEILERQDNRAAVWKISTVDHYQSAGTICLVFTNIT